MLESVQTKQKLKFIKECLLHTKDIPGTIAEVGVFGGGTLFEIATWAKAAEFGKQVVGYDTFEGLPEATALDNGHKKGDFTYTAFEELQTEFTNANLPVTLVKGRFPMSAMDLPQLDYSFIHLDVDFYQETLNSLRYFATSEALLPGALIVIDDYKWRATLGVEPAVTEFLASAKGSSFKVHKESLHQICLVKV